MCMCVYKGALLHELCALTCVCLCCGSSGEDNCLHCRDVTGLVCMCGSECVRQCCLIYRLVEADA